MQMNKVDIIFLMRDIYINPNLDPLIEFSTSSQSTESYKDIFAWGISQIIMKIFLISKRIVMSCAMRRVSLFEFHRKLMKIDPIT